MTTPAPYETVNEFDMPTLLLAHVVIVSAFLVVFGLVIIPWQVQFFTEGFVIEAASHLSLLSAAFGLLFLMMSIPIFIISSIASGAERAVRWFDTPPKTVPDTDPKRIGASP